MLVNKYNYPKLKRIQTAAGRRYSADGEEITAVPSVTTILSETGDKSHLIAWRQRVGEAEATRISTEAAGFGTKVHDALEKYSLGEEYEITGNNLVHTMARRAVDVMIKNGLSKVDEIWGVEVGLIAEGLYAGTTDCVGLFEGKPAIIDFKTAKKIKKKDWITDYFLQCSAYALAHEEMFGDKIDCAAILMVDREGNYADFVVEGAEFDDYKAQWAQRVIEYYDKVGVN